MNLRPKRTLARPAARLLAVALGLALALLAAEFGLRLLLFHPAAEEWTAARALRRPEFFARSGSDDLYYALVRRFTPPAARTHRPPWAPHHDARLGWTSERFAPESYAHVHEDRLDGRRLMLLFGDSFAAGVAGPESHFEALLEAAPEGRKRVLLNYGVAGYGFDQAWLLSQEVLERFREQAPLVLIGILVDDDLDRMLLSFRDWPKPRLVLERGHLRPARAAVPRLEEGLADPQLWPRSFALAFARRALGPRGLRGTPEQEAEKQALARSVLRRWVADLRGAGLCFAVVLFHGPEATRDPDTTGWRHAFLVDELTRLDVPHAQVRDDLLAAESAGEAPLPAFFRNDGHLSAAGNRIALRTLLRALDHCGPP